MKQTIIRLLLIAVLVLVLLFVFKLPPIESWVIGFVIAYVLEPLIIEKT